MTPIMLSVGLYATSIQRTTLLFTKDVFYWRKARCCIDTIKILCNLGGDTGSKTVYEVLADSAFCGTDHSGSAQGAASFVILRLHPGEATTTEETLEVFQGTN